MSPQGIGGDDRCGVFALCHIFHAAQVKPWLLFCCNEEVGGLGAKNFCLAHQQHLLLNELDNLKLIIELDRKGSHDAVFYRCDNPDFEQYITSKGFKTAQGSFSDISLIAPELGIAAVNLSCGYYHAHTLHEYINRSHLEHSIEKVAGFVSNSIKSNFPSFLFIPKAYLQHDLQRNSYSEKKLQQLPFQIFQIYRELLDFYSPDYLAALRKTYGNEVLLQLYSDEFNCSFSNLLHLYP